MPEDILKFHVSGFTIGGSGDTEGVVISGYKKLESGNVVNFNTPFQKFDDDKYELSGELYEAVSAAKNEVYEYMEGKQAPRSEVGKFDFDEDDDAFAMSETKNEE